MTPGEVEELANHAASIHHCTWGFLGTLRGLADGTVLPPE